MAAPDRGVIAPSTEAVRATGGVGGWFRDLDLAELGMGCAVVYGIDLRLLMCSPS